MQPLQVLFLADFYNEMPKIVHLMDPLGNVFIISIKQRPSRVYLHHGASRIGEVYNLFSDGWISKKIVNFLFVRVAFLSKNLIISILHSM